MVSVKPGPKRRPIAERFWEKVVWNGDEDECWEWQGATRRGGYGTIGRGGTRGVGNGNVSAHRFSWEFFNGSIPEDLHVLHACDNPACVNPAHLWLGTNADNSADRDQKGRGRWAPPKGERHWRAKLNPDAVRAIREGAKRGVRWIDLAERFGVSESAVAHVLCGRTWTHVT
jgi:hypothetical protein